MSVVLLVIAANAGFSQQLVMGPKLGLNASRMGGVDAGGFWQLDQTSTGFSLGGYLSYTFGPYFSMQPEAYLTRRGGRGGDASGTGSLILHYVEVPILAKVTLPTKSKFVPYFLAGPSFLFRVGCNVEMQSSEGNKRGACDDWVFESPMGNIAVDAENHDVALVFGMGVDMPLGNGYLAVDIRYGIGLTSVDKSYLDTDLTNRALQFMVGYGFINGR